MENTKKFTDSVLRNIAELSLEGKELLFEIMFSARTKTIEQEVVEKARVPHERGKEYSRWGSNPGSLTTEKGKIKVQVPRLLD